MGISIFVWLVYVLVMSNLCVCHLQCNKNYYFICNCIQAQVRPAGKNCLKKSFFLFRFFLFMTHKSLSNPEMFSLHFLFLLKH